MTKKIIAVILAFVLTFSASLTVCAASSDDVFSALKSDAETVSSATKRISELTISFAGDLEPYIMDTVLTSDNIEKAVDIGSKLMLKFIEGIKPDDPDDPDVPDVPDEPSEPSQGAIDMTVAELKKILQTYIFVEVDDVDASVLATLSGVKYYPVTLENGEKTVYVAVDIENNPDIFNYDVFKKTVEQLYEKQGEALITDEDGNTDYLMSYEHIAGELAFHAIVYAAANELISVTGTKNETIISLYNSAAIADLNVDESRLPWQVFSILGIIIMELFSLKVFSLLKI